MLRVFRASATASNFISLAAPSGSVTLATTRSHTMISAATPIRFAPKAATEGSRRFVAKPPSSNSGGSGVGLGGAKTTSSSSSSASTSSSSPSQGGSRSRTLFSEFKRTLRSYLPISWIRANATALFTYQLFLETMLTGMLGACLWDRWFEVKDVKAFLEGSGYPFMELCDFETCIYSKDVKLGDRVVDKHMATSFHCAHNTAVGLMPLQLVVLATTYPLVKRLWFRGLRPLVCKLPIVGPLMKPMELPAEAAHWMNRTFGTTRGGAAVVGTEAAAAAAAAAAAGPNSSPSSPGIASAARSSGMANVKAATSRR